MAEEKGFSKGGPFTAIDKVLIDCVEIKVEAWDRFNEVAAKALAIVVSPVIMKLTEQVEFAATGGLRFDQSTVRNEGACICYSVVSGQHNDAEDVMSGK